MVQPWGQIRELYEVTEVGERPVAAATLGVMGPEARSALPALREVYADPNPRIRSRALEAIKLIDPKTAKSLK